jgi:hypothetical protein
MMHQQQLIPIGTQDNARQDAHDDDTANEAEHPKAAADTEQAPRTRFAQRTPAHRPPGVLLKIISSHNDLVAQRDDEVKRLRAEMEQMRGRHKQEIKAFETQLFIQRANLESALAAKYQRNNAPSRQSESQNIAELHRVRSELGRLKKEFAAVMRKNQLMALEIERLHGREDKQQGLLIQAVLSSDEQARSELGLLKKEFADVTGRNHSLAQEIERLRRKEGIQQDRLIQAVLGSVTSLPEQDAPRAARPPPCSPTFLRISSRTSSPFTPAPSSPNSPVGKGSGSGEPVFFEPSPWAESQPQSHRSAPHSPQPRRVTRLHRSVTSRSVTRSAPTLSPSRSLVAIAYAAPGGGDGLGLNSPSHRPNFQCRVSQTHVAAHLEAELLNRFETHYDVVLNEPK